MHAHRAVLGLFLSGVLMASHLGTSDAQWIQTNGPKGGFIRSFVAVPNGGGTSLYAGQQRIWRTAETRQDFETVAKNGSRLAWSRL
jgi:hypothetical protein